MQIHLFYRYRRTEPVLDEHALAFWPGGIDDEVPVSYLTQRQYRPPIVFLDDEILPFWPGGIDDEVPVSSAVQRVYRPVWISGDDDVLGFTPVSFGLEDEIPWVGVRQASYVPPIVFQDDEQLASWPGGIDEDLAYVPVRQRSYVPPWLWSDDEILGGLVGPALFITGTTLEECTLAIVAGATVKLYRTSDDSLVATTISDGTGFYSFAVSDLDFYYARAYRAGAPDEAGTTRNDLQGS